jgi:alkylhydroperoxidase/carboxymuconolactone decarboxylase family protein YurZ
VEAGATRDEIFEAVSVAIVMGGTAVSAETWRVVKVLEEMEKYSV